MNAMGRKKMVLQYRRSLTPLKLGVLYGGHTFVWAAFRKPTLPRTNTRQSVYCWDYNYHAAGQSIIVCC